MIGTIRLPIWRSLIRFRIRRVKAEVVEAFTFSPVPDRRSLNGSPAGAGSDPLRTTRSGTGPSRARRRDRMYSSSSDFGPGW